MSGNHLRQHLPPCPAIRIRAPIPKHQHDHTLQLPAKSSPPVVVNVKHFMATVQAHRGTVLIGITKESFVRLEIDHTCGDHRASLLTGRIRLFKARFWWRREEFNSTHGTPRFVVISVCPTPSANSSFQRSCFPSQPLLPGPMATMCGLHRWITTPPLAQIGDHRSGGSHHRWKWISFSPVVTIKALHGNQIVKKGQTFGEGGCLRQFCSV